MMNLLTAIFFIVMSQAFAQGNFNEEEVLRSAQESFKALPDKLIDEAQSRNIISLGKKLYLEKKLSASGTISCNSCHGLDNYGVDNQATSPGHDSTRGARNSPTSFNAALNSSQFWDGREKDVESQALGPLLNPIEHGLKDKAEALSKIKSNEYIALFKKANLKFDFENIGKAIGAFERTLLTPSRFDDYLKGDTTALSFQEKRGLKKFMRLGCTSCHSGVNLGGNSFQKMGLVKKYPTKDLGRYDVTKRSRDKYKFKVPTLRNVEKTGPYLHDGSLTKLREAISIMGEYQLGKKLRKHHLDDLEAFMKALTSKKDSYL